MKNRASDYENVSVKKYKPSVSGKKDWQSPQLNEIDYRKTSEQAGEGIDDNFTAVS